MKVDVVVDVGNTRIKWGLCQGAKVQCVCVLPPDDHAAWLEQIQAWNVHEDARWLVAGVQPAGVRRFADWMRSATVVESREQIPVDVRVDEPHRVGLDRLFNAVAVNSRRRPGQPAVLVDAGSAVTVDFVDGDGAFRGGAILPGLGLMTQVLHTRTAQLPVVEIKRRLHPPETSTERAIELGVFHAVLGGIELLVRELHAAAATQLPVFFAGGDAALLAPHLPWAVTVWPEMTLEGIRLTGEKLPESILNS